VNATVAQFEAVTKDAREGVLITCLITRPMSLGDGEGIDLGLEVHNEATKGRNSGAKDADIHHDSGYL
jgi:hypothetical protein